MIEKQFNVDNIIIQNVPLNYEAESMTQEITNVRIIGPKDVVEGMVAGDIVATIDLQESSSVSSGAGRASS